MRGRGRERGNVGVWAALTFTAVGSFMALAVHAGRSYSNRVELQSAADAAALAAAAHLDGTQAGIDAATAAAAAFAARHRTEDQVVTVAPADVTFGAWDRATHTFTPIAGRTAADLRNIIAAQVHDARLDLPVAFGPVFLRAGTTTSVRSSAVAVGGGPCEDRCAFPAAFADCMLLDADGNLRCEDRFYVLNSDWQDNLGLTSLDPARSASVPNIKDAIASCVETQADTLVPVTNGNALQPVFTHPTPSYPFEVIAPVVHPERCESPHYEPCVGGSPTSPCANAKFNGDMPIVGYISLIVCYVTTPSGTHWPLTGWGSGTPEQAPLWAECGPAPTQADFPNVPAAVWGKQTIFLKQRCHWIDPGNRSRRGGCQSFGVWTTRSRLVE